MITLEEELSFSGSDIDLAIRALEEPPKGCKSDLLLADQSVPVCSLDYLQREGPIQSPEDLVRHKLIAYNGAPTEWPFWLASHGVGCPELDYSLTFDTRTGTLQAACEGLGVAISRGPFADFMIERGHLLVPISAPVSAGMSYYLLTAERSWSIPSVKLFRRWLLSTCRRRSTAAYRQVEVAV